MTPLVHTARELLSLELPERRMLLGPWLPVGGLAMLYAARGVGKSHLALGIARAVAVGEDFLGWSSGGPHGVLYVDGEMHGPELRGRVQMILGADTPDSLRFVVADLQPQDLPCLTTSEGHEAFIALADGSDLIIFDNLASLVRSGAENDAEAWRDIQRLLLRLRRAGKSVLVIHHAGKRGDQRGTSAREDVMDTVIRLTQPDDYSSEDGARFEVHFTKGRGFYGESARAFEARISRDGQGWERQPLRATGDIAEMLAMREAGKSMEAIAEAFGVDKSTVSRRLAAVRK